MKATIEKKRQRAIKEYKRQLQSLQNLVANELEDIAKEGEEFKPSSAMHSISSEIIRIYEELKTLQDLILEDAASNK